MSSSYSPQGPHAERSDDVLRRLWASKDWADILVICTDNKEIKAHRAVVCTRSKFFDSCCRLGFVETATGRINLTEEAEIVEGLLEHLYGVEVSLMKPFNASESSEQPELQNLRQQLMKLVQQYKCADKYAIPELRAQVAETFASRLQAVEDPATILDIASAVYESTPYFDIELRSAMITQVQGHLDTILSTDETASALLENHELNLDILRRVAPILRQQTEALSSDGSGGPTPPTTPTKKRKSPRIGTHTPGTYAFRGRWS